MRNTTPLFDMGTPAVDLTHAGRVSTDLEDEAILSRLTIVGSDVDL